MCIVSWESLFCTALHRTDTPNTSFGACQCLLQVCKGFILCEDISLYVAMDYPSFGILSPQLVRYDYGHSWLHDRLSWMLKIMLPRISQHVQHSCARFRGETSFTYTGDDIRWICQMTIFLNSRTRSIISQCDDYFFLFVPFHDSFPSFFLSRTIFGIYLKKSYENRY